MIYSCKESTFLLTGKLHNLLFTPLGWTVSQGNRDGGLYHRHGGGRTYLRRVSFRFLKWYNNQSKSVFIFLLVDLTLCQGWGAILSNLSPLKKIKDTWVDLLTFPNCCLKTPICQERKYQRNIYGGPGKISKLEWPYGTSPVFYVSKISWAC